MSKTGDYFITVEDALESVLKQAKCDLKRKQEELTFFSDDQFDQYIELETIVDANYKAINVIEDYIVNMPDDGHA